MLYEKGVFINSCFELLNLTRPELVRQIHAEYIQAGADIIVLRHPESLKRVRAAIENLIEAPELAQL